VIAPSVLSYLTEIVEKRLVNSEPAHDFGHVLRVVDTVQMLCEAEGGDLSVAHLSALLHELINLPKNHPDSARSGEFCALEASALLKTTNLESDVTKKVCECIRVHSFSAGIEAKSLEAQILQDADRLDAIGAIGIARCFATCATMNRPFYDPRDPFCETRDPDDQQWGLDHFYRKLLVIQERLNTRSARLIAEQRTLFLKRFLKQFRSELSPQKGASYRRVVPNASHVL
jgi:uncharacterized protein